MGERRYGRSWAGTADSSADLCRPDPGIRHLAAVQQMKSVLDALCALAFLQQWDREVTGENYERQDH
jgi:hypothetical protein